MLPGFRILFALVVLSLAILIFGFGALALLRTAHQNLASQPAWQPAWRTPLEVASAQRGDRHMPSESQTLALLRVEVPAARPVSGIEGSPASAEPVLAPAQSTVQPPVEDAQSIRPERDPAAEVKPQQPAEASVVNANADDHPITGRPTEPSTASDEKPVEPAARPAPADNAPKPTASNSNEAPAATDALSLPTVATQISAPPAPEPGAAVPSVKVEEPVTERASSENSSPPAEPPTRLAALPDAPTSASEALPKAGQQGMKKPDAAELRAKRRARARLRARRLALARARAARLAQAQQAATNSVFYNSAFPTSTSTATNTASATNAPNATPMTTPFGPRTAP